MPYRNLAFIAACLGEKYSKALYVGAQAMFFMGSAMCSRESVHNRIDALVEEIAKEADLSDTLKDDLWQAFRLIAVDGLELKQDPDLEYENLQETREYLNRMIK